MAESFYEPDDGSADQDGPTRWRASAATEGPWSSRLQHGGPPSALLVRAAERAAHRQTGREELQAVRVVVDFLGPVPVEVVEVRAELVRAGRSAVLVDCELSAAGRTALRARTWLGRRRPQPRPAGARPPAGAPTPAGGPTSATATPPATALPPAAPDPDELPDDDRW